MIASLPTIGRRLLLADRHRVGSFVALDILFFQGWWLKLCRRITSALVWLEQFDETSSCQLAHYWTAGEVRRLGALASQRIDRIGLNRCQASGTTALLAAHRRVWHGACNRCRLVIP